MMNTLLPLSFCALLLGAPGTASLDADLQRVTALRSEVNQLARDLTDSRAQGRSRRQSLDAQIAHLELQVRQEKIRETTLLQKRRQLLDQQASLEARRDTLLKPTLEAVDVLRAHVNNSLPYKQAERLKTLSQIETSLTSTEPDPTTALSKLWQFIQDERTLTRELGLQQQVITLGGASVLVDVAHLGMAGLYFKTTDERYGWATSGQGAWSYQFFADPAQVEAARELFKALAENRRTGYFSLPLSLPAGDPS
ncbi:MAG: DUF3450 family protein [Myxococcota bacterium]|nr:DUF3450 family protein [Myxococcota bacterium]